MNILEKAKIDNSKVVFLSTYVYGDPSYLPIDESHKLEPLNPYTQSKLICEDLCSAYFRDFKVPVTILRPFNIYGNNQNKNFIIPTIIGQVNNKEIILNSSNTRRDFIYISDIVDVIIKIVDLDSSLLSIYNLGSGESVSIREVVEKILILTDSQAKIKVVNKERRGEVVDTVADISKIKNDLHWQPKVLIDDGLKLMLEN